MYLFPLFSPLLGCTEEVSLPLSLSPPTSLFTPSFCRQKFRSCVPSNVTAPPSGKLPQASRMENAYRERPTLCSQQPQGPPASRSVSLRRQRGNCKSQILFPVTRQNVLLYHRHGIIPLCTWWGNRGSSCNPLPCIFASCKHTLCTNHMPGLGLGQAGGSISKTWSWRHSRDTGQSDVPWRELQQQGHCEGSMLGVTTNATVPPEKGTWDGGTRGAEAGAR